MYFSDLKATERILVEVSVQEALVMPSDEEGYIKNLVVETSPKKHTGVCNPVKIRNNKLFEVECGESGRTTLNRIDFYNNPKLYRVV